MDELTKEKIERVEMMASGDSTWDLSEKDVSALRHVLDRLADQIERIARLEAENKRLSAPVSDEEWETTKLWCIDGKPDHTIATREEFDYIIAARGQQDKPSCDCHLHERQVCDVCQGVTGAQQDKEPA